MEKRKFSFNIIDLLIIVFVVGVATAVYFLFFRGGGDASAEQQDAESFKVRYVIRVDKLPAKFQDNVNDEEHEKFIDYATQCSIGTVISSERETYYYLGNDKISGEQVRTPDDDYVNLYITVEANATLVNNQYVINGTNMFVGKRIDAMLQNLFCSGTCISIDKVE